GVALLVRWRLGGTRAGRALLAVRDVEARANAFGVETGAMKLLAYTISGALVGLGGALLAFKNAPGTLTATDPFVLLRSLLLVAMGEGSEAAAHLRDVPRGLLLHMPVRALLEARKVTVRYGGVNALSDIDLEARRGEIVGLIGANGAGKSTFFNATSGFAPTTGSIRYRGIELLTNPPARRTSYGLARTFQDMGLVRADTVAENVLL